jgi:hypothetical protein
MKITRSFTKGRMNKVFDERLIPNGEYIDAMNVRLGSTEESEMGAIENAKGNEQITELEYEGTALSEDAVCIGSMEDTSFNTIYWCVHDPSWKPIDSVETRILDMIVSYDVVNDVLIYNVTSINDGVGTETVLNFDPLYRVNAMDKVDNLLFINDFKNPPRRFNVLTPYSQPSALDINVIVQPPLEAPRVVPIKQNGQETYLDTRFISFAYRYKYKDGEYSALSQFSKIAFAPNDFKLNYDTFQNDGMTNIYNSAIIYLNTSTSRVVGLDLVFKFSNSNVINIVEKYDKETLGWSDGMTAFVTFTNKKVYTTLPEIELFRLFDNVPHKAQAQTIMGNRLMYGNYVEGYNVIDEDGRDCKIQFTTEVISTPVVKEVLPITKSSSNYTIDASLPQDINNSTANIDLGSVSSDLTEGSKLTISMNLFHDSYISAGVTPSTIPTSINISTSITLQNDYASVALFVASPEFEAAIGETTFTPIDDCGTVDAGNSLTDQIRCGSFIPASPLVWFKENSGVTADGEGINVSTTGDTFSLTVVAMRYDLTTSPGTYNAVYEYFQISYVNAVFYKEDIGRSLHSKRDYETSIIYMDEYNRSTTSLVSIGNTVYVEPNKSASKNNIRVTIPTTQRPPYWATKYKFALKPSELEYETIYSNILFNDQSSGVTYFLLNGDNQNKCSIGDTLRVKGDINGAVLKDTEVTVADISAKAKGFLDSSSSKPVEPAGLYMQIRTSDINLTLGNTYFTYGETLNTVPDPYLKYPVSSANEEYNPGIAISPSNYPWTPWKIPSGSLVSFNFKIVASTAAGDYQEYKYNKSYVSSNDYDDMYAFIQGDNISFDTGTFTVNDNKVYNDVVYYDNLYDYITASPGDNWIEGMAMPENEFRIQLLWYNPSEAGYLDIGAGLMYFGLKSSSQGLTVLPGLICEVSVLESRPFVFETIPTEADPDVFYEDSDVYDIVDGFHAGNIQTQTGTLPAISDLSFFDCFCFGNGVESYKIGDGLATPSFTLGERFYAVSQEDYKEAERFADITYSGIYNAETNVNKLNEFNLALANFKSLEKSFGSIRVLSGRANDVLTLQEDKISYVLSSKELISSASGGGTISSVPEVLGTQIARIENFGISNNPESYTEWGYDKFFLDSKRSSLIKLTGSGYDEQLTVISNLGMRSWFRDYLKITPTTQKLGGYDPYMGEYVLAGNLDSLPLAPFIVQCGERIRKTTDVTSVEWDVILSPGSGTCTVNYAISFIPDGGTANVTITYNGTPYTSGDVTGIGSFTFVKVVGVETASVEVTLSAPVTVTYSVTVGCPVDNNPQITQVALSTVDTGINYIHNEFFWTQGTYVSPTQSELVLIQSTDDQINVNQFTTLTGNSGVGMIPPTTGGSTTIRIQSTKRDFDDFTFGTSELKYLLSATELDNSPAGITSMISVATTLTPLVNPSTGIYYYDITYTQVQAAFKPYIYLIYDYR